MKKFYSLTLAAAVTLSAAAATVNVTDVTAKKQLRNFDLKAAQTPKADLSKKEFNTFKLTEVAPSTNRAKSPAAYTELLGDWDCTYTDLDDKLISTEATITWDADYSELNIAIPGTYANLPLVAEYDEATGVLTFKQLSWGSNGQYYVLQVPGNPTAYLSSATATYDAESKTISFDDEDTDIGHMAATATGSPVGYYWYALNLKLVKPEFDYSVNVRFREECTPDNNFIFDITRGSDVASVYILDTDGLLTAQAVIDQLGEDFVKTYGTPATGSTYNFDLSGAEESDFYTVMVFAFDSEGKLVKKAEDSVIITAEDNEEYVTIATIPFTDSFVNGVYSNFSHRANVELQESVEAPGKYRLVNPYNSHSWAHDRNCAHHIYFDAQDPQFVDLGMAVTGLDAGDGIITLFSYTVLGNEKEAIQSAGLNGTLNGRTISFPAKSLLEREKDYGFEDFYYVNSNSPIKFELPELVLNVTVVDGTDQPIEGVTLNVEAYDADAAEPSAIAELDGDAYVTGADGKVSIVLPASIDYLASVKVTAVDGFGNEDSKLVQLEGANNDLTFGSNVMTAVNDINVSSNNAVEYFNLQGVKIANPAKGQLVIKRQGNEVSKVLVK